MESTDNGLTDGFKEGDRVKRNDESSVLGTVLSIRDEIDTSNTKAAETPKLIKIKWDNGKVSYFDPESVVIA